MSKCLFCGYVRRPQDELTYPYPWSCPHCGEVYGDIPEKISPPSISPIKKKCLNCGYERQEKDDLYGIIPSTECPKCHAIYEIAEKYLKEKERQIREKKEQEERELQAQQARYRKDLEEREKSELVKQLKQVNPKAQLGFFMKIAVKTAVKKSLLEITDRLNLFPNLNMKEKVEMFVTFAGMTNELPHCEHWEGTFSLLVIGQTRGQLTTLSNFNDYTPIILNLTADWIDRVLGGKSENLYAEIVRLGSKS